MTEPEFIKVSLPGESPWVEIVTVESPSVFWGKFANDLLGRDSAERRRAAGDAFFGVGAPLRQMHDYKLGDVERFELFPDGAGHRWLPSPVKTQ